MQPCESHCAQLNELEEAVGATLNEKEEEMLEESRQRRLTEEQNKRLEERNEELTAEISKLQQVDGSLAVSKPTKQSSRAFADLPEGVWPPLVLESDGV